MVQYPTQYAFFSSLYLARFSTFEAVALGFVGIFIFRLGFYRDNEWFGVINGIFIMSATVAFIVSVSWAIITHV